MSHRLLAPSLLLTAALTLPGLAACGQDSSSPATSTTEAAERTAAESGPSASSAAATRTSATDAADPRDVDLEGRTIAIDPGHNGGNASHPEEINRQVPDGRGGTKACNTTGTSTNSDYSEADFTWAVATKLRGVARGRRRDGRAQPEGQHGRRALRGRARNLRRRRRSAREHPRQRQRVEFGRRASTSSSPIPVRMRRPRRPRWPWRSRWGIRWAIPSPRTEAYGEDAISRRPDLAGLNNASVPAVIVECAERCAIPTRRSSWSRKSGRRKYADALFHGIVDWF
jgi:N-acetylmuramoyl-L-alanine amidase